MVAVFFAQGTEEIEALTQVDVLRRAGVETCLVGVGGKVLAGAAVDLLQDPALVQAAKDEHARRMGGAKYVCPIPAGVKPRKMR